MTQAIRGGLERQWWADAPMNGGKTVPMGRERNPHGLRRRDPRASAMKPQIKLSINVNVANCLWAIAAIINVLM
jgi:hypothetical protein